MKMIRPQLARFIAGSYVLAQRLRGIGRKPLPSQPAKLATMNMRWNGSKVLPSVRGG